MGKKANLQTELGEKTQAFVRAVCVFVTGVTVNYFLIGRCTLLPPDNHSTVIIIITPSIY